MPEYVHFIWLSAAGIGLFALAEWMYHYRKVHPKITRKMVHVCMGLLTLFFPVLFKNPWWVLLMCGLFQLVLVLSINYGYLKSIHGPRRKTYGSLVYPMVVYFIYLAWFYSVNPEDQINRSYAYFYLPILILALGDAMASYIGRTYPFIIFRKFNKSLGGSLAFWAVAFLLSCFILVSSHLFNNKDIIWVAIFIATAASVTEFYSTKGLGNLFIPIVVLLVMYLVEYFF